MPCNRVAVKTAQLGLNLASELNQVGQEFRDYLASQGVTGVENFTLMTLDHVELPIDGARLVILGQQATVRYLGRSRANGDRALEACQQFAGEQLQIRVLETLKARGLHISSIQQNAQTGAVSLMAEL